jgi:hypothetical protein
VFGEDQGQHVWRTWSRAVVPTAVFLTWIEDREPGRTHVGSGVALRTPLGVPIILTAAHVARAMRGNICFAGWHRLGTGHSLEHSEVHCHPHAAVDVAAIIPGRRLGLEMLGVAESVARVASRYQALPRDVFGVIGYPADMLRLQSSRNEKGFATFSWFCPSGSPPIHRPDDDLLEFDWVATGQQVYSLDDGARLERASPDRANGMSGGPLWRYQSERAVLDSAAAWQIVGLQCEYRSPSRAVYFEPVDRWYRWFSGLVASIDGRWRTQTAGLSDVC